jgi:hypothetical protein
MNEKIIEKHVDVAELMPGMAVVIADYSETPTAYSYGQVTEISPTLSIITVGDMSKFDSQGWAYTSNNKMRYSKRLLQVTPELALHIEKQKYIKYLFSIDWSIQTYATLYRVYQAFSAGLGEVTKK